MSKKVLVVLLCILLVVIAVTVGIVFRKNESSSQNVIKNYDPSPTDNSSIKQVPSKLAKYSSDNESLSLEIPSNWDFEVLNEDENNNYGIKFYPENETNYAVLYNKKEKFGVCGTGLETKSLSTINNINAEIGYFDGNPDWNYVTFEKANTNLVAYNKGLTGENAKEAIEILKTMIYTNKGSITMTIKEGSLTKTSATVILQDTSNNESFGTGASFSIEKNVNGFWLELSKQAEISWIEIWYAPNEDGIIEQNLNWEDLYGELPEGNYRIVKNIGVLGEVYAEFSI